jgi:hypothetical protein
VVDDTRYAVMAIRVDPAVNDMNDTHLLLSAR